MRTSLEGCGEWVAPLSGQYFENVTPVTGQTLCEIPRSNAADVDRALDAAHAAKKAWGKTSTTERGRMLEKIAQRIEENLEMLATVETWDNGKRIARRWGRICRWPSITSVILPG